MRAIAANGGVVLTLLASLSVLSQGQDAIIVYATNWEAKGKGLQRGDRLPSGTSSEGASGSRLLVDCGTSQLVYSCTRSDGGSCRAAICRDRTVEGGEVTDLSSAVAQTAKSSGATESGFWAFLTQREPRQVNVAAARVPGSPADAVVRLEAQGLHLGPALNRVLEGTYCFELRSLPVTEGSIVHRGSIRWDRASDSEGVASATSVTPGLYELRKGLPAGGRCTFDQDALPAWVLIVSPRVFDRIDGVWKQNLSVFDRLAESSLDTALIATLRHAALAALAETAGQ